MQALFRIGPTVGDRPISYPDMLGWVAAWDGIELTGWEMETLQGLSGTYLARVHEYQEDRVMQPHLSDEGKRRLALQQERMADRALGNSADGTEYRRSRGKRTQA